MTSSIPPDPQPSRRSTLGFKEAVGVFVAFTTIGAILFWSLTREDEGFNLPIVQLPSASPEPAPLPTPTPEPSPTQVGPEAVGPRMVGPGAVGSGTVGPGIVGSGTVGSRTVGPKIVGDVKFSDVPDDYWALPFITALSQRRIISGFNDGTFRPDQPVTRSEYAAMIQRAFDQSPSQSAQEYTDIPSGYWAAPAIQEATTTDFLNGYPGNVFRPNQQIPRVQVLVALVSGLGLSAQSSPDQALGIYQDTEQIPTWATGQVAAASEAGLVVNHPDRALLNPNQNATRAEVAAFIYQALAKAGQVRPINSNYIIQPRP